MRSSKRNGKKRFIILLSWQKFISNFSLYTKLLISFLIVILIPAFFISWNSLKLSSNSLNRNMDEQLLFGQRIVTRIYKNEIVNLENIADIKAKETLLQEAVSSKNIFTLLRVLSSNFIDKYKINIAEVLDSQGEKLSGRGNLPEGFHSLDSKLLNFIIENRLTVNQVEMTNEGILIKGAAAIIDPDIQSKVNGVFMVAKVLNKNYFLSLDKELGMEFLLFDKNGNLVTSSFSELKINNPGFDETITEKDLLWKNMDLVGESYRMVGYPLKDHQNELIGYLALALPRDPILMTEKKMTTTIIIYTILSIIITSLIALFLTWNISNPIKRIIQLVDKIADGDLQQEIRVEGKDELEHLKGSIKQMLKNLRELIFEVKAGSKKITETAEELSTSTQETAAITQQVSATSDRISSETEEQAGQINEVIQLVRQMLSSNKNISDGVQLVAEKSNLVNEQVESGQDSLEKLLLQIEKMASIVEDSTQVIQQLDIHSQEINNIINLISEISEQTNLLALNAAIEAARAGEHGRGFAVVADEVRTLANQSNRAATNIYKIISEIQGETKNAVKVMNEESLIIEEGIEIGNRAQQAFADIQQAVKTTVHIADEIALATKEQSKNNEEVTNTIEEFDQVTKNTVEEIKQINQAINNHFHSMDGLATLSESLLTMVDRLYILLKKFRT